MGIASQDEKAQEAATQAEARKAIEALSEVDFAKLTLIARMFVKTRIRGPIIEPDDLIHEAIAKTLDGRRKWNRKVSILKHLDRVMESDSSHEAEEEVNHPTAPIPDGSGAPVAKTPDPAERMAALDELENALKPFAEDKIALEVLRLKGIGLSASEIQRDLGMDKTRYESVTKRIRRRLAHL